MSSEDLIRVKHMLDAATKAIAFTSGLTRNDLESSEPLTLALVRLLEILGEAAKNVSEDFRQAHPEIPWRQIGGTRDRLIHGYFDVDLDIIWLIVTSDLPSLIRHLKNALS
jgi:uncharacterized protein with HEPN domain